MNFYLVAFLSLTILIAGTIALFRFNSINKVYHPFIYFIWLGCINEIFSISIAMSGYRTLVNNNIYALLAALLLTLFFKEIRTIKQRGVFLLLISIIVLTWIAENFIFSSITVNSTYFRIIIAFIIVILSVITINKLLFTNLKLIKNATFLICISLILFFTYRILVQSFSIYGFNRNSNFLLNLYAIMSFVNLGANLINALAVLWMPRKDRFIPEL